LTEWKAPTLICTLAAAYAESGDFDRAVEVQQRANDLADDDDGREIGRKLLEQYRGRKPIRSTPD
jgi:hypothetical protein